MPKCISLSRLFLALGVIALLLVYTYVNVTPLEDDSSTWILDVTNSSADNVTLLKYGVEVNDWAVVANSWVCVEGPKPGKKKVVVYKSSRTELKISHSFPVAIEPASHPPNFSRLLENRTVYFVVTRGYKHHSFVGNLHHYFNDLAIPLYSVQSTIHPLQQHTIVLNRPGNFDRWKSLNEGLGFYKEHQFGRHVLNHVPSGTCFGQAVFFDATHHAWRKGLRMRHHHYDAEVRPLIQHWKKRLNITDAKCNGSSPRITIIRRTGSRQIYNLPEVLASLAKSGFNNTRAVRFEKLSVVQQVQLAHCTDVLIGVHGAGMQWAAFLQEGKSMIEISWPTSNWYFFYSSPDVGRQFYAKVRRFQVQVPKDLMTNNNARVPPNALVSRVQRAVSGAPSRAPWKRFEIGHFKNRRKATREEATHGKKVF